MSAEHFSTIVIGSGSGGMPVAVNKTLRSRQ